MKTLNRHPSLWLLAGALLLVLSQMRFGLGVLAWVAPIPWLHFLRVTHGRASRGAFVAVGTLAFTAATLKIVTDPLPPAIAVMYGLPLALAHCLPFLGWDALRRRLGESWGTIAFPALMVLGEWSLHGLLPFGTWGAMANTQLDQVALLQLASITGIHGISFLMLVVAATLERALSGERASLRNAAVAVAVALFTVVCFGQARLALATSQGSDTRRVAAVGTDSVVGASGDLPDEKRLREVERGLVLRTERAASAGATLVVWNEAATMVRPPREAAWKVRLQHLAQHLKIDLVAAYVVPISESPLRYENKYLFVRPDGSIHHSYFKHEPVPGEPAVRGVGPLPLVENEGEGSVSGAICYDYDFPRLGLEHARLGADIVALPSSDWRGIAPLHTEMAALRAIEGGHSVVRSTRFGLSAGIDPWGKMRGLLSHFDGEERVLIVDLPTAGVTTIYGRLGDWFPLACFVLVLSATATALRRRTTQPDVVVGSPDEFDGPVGSISGRA
jgi:apolipoprotein N-acyltransferase